MIPINTCKRKPLWMTADAVTLAVPAECPKPPKAFWPKEYIRGGSPVRVIAEPGNEGSTFGSIAAAAAFFKISEAAIHFSLKTGGRAAGKLFWYRDRPLSDRPPEPAKSKCRPVKVGDAIFPSITAAARAMGLPAKKLHSSLRKGWLIDRPIGYLRPRRRAA